VRRTLADIAGSMQLTKTCVYYYVQNQRRSLSINAMCSSCDMWMDRVQQANQLPGNGVDKIVSMVKGHFYQYVETLQGHQSPISRC
jgi:hypothetical protein